MEKDILIELDFTLRMLSPIFFLERYFRLFGLGLGKIKHNV